MDLLEIPLADYERWKELLEELVSVGPPWNVRSLAKELGLTQKQVVMLAEDSNLNIDVAIQVGNGMASLRMGDWLVYPLD